jgi:hypothetical protein
MATKITVTIVFFELAGKKKYVAEMPLRWDNKIIPILRDSIDDAHQFEDEADAQKKISNFFNPHSREFKTMPHQADISKKKLFIKTTEEDIQ